MNLSLSTGIVPLETAGLFPSFEHLAMYYQLNRGVRFAKLLVRSLFPCNTLGKFCRYFKHRRKLFSM